MDYSTLKISLIEIFATILFLSFAIPSRNRKLRHVEDQSVAVAGLTLGADPLVSGVAMAASLADGVTGAVLVRSSEWRGSPHTVVIR